MFVKIGKTNGQVIIVDTEKTGSLIAECRKECGLTQKQLAEKLNVSDRTVSKWERGAGFPDVAMLTPLADALGISVVDLLQGERACEQDAEVSVRNAIGVVFRQTRRRVRKNMLSIVLSFFLAVFFIWFVWAVLEYNGVFLKEVSLSVPIIVYEDGEAVADSFVTISGKRGKSTFAGTFAVDCVEKTKWSGVQGYISWEEPNGYDTIKFFAYGGPWDCGIERPIYISENMTRMAMQLEDGKILATDESLMQLMSLKGYYPLDF